MKTKSQDDILDEVYEHSLDEVGFKGMIFMSTDGKMTVSIESTTADGRMQGYRWAKRVYDDLRINYGSKQAHAVKEYKHTEEELNGNGHTNGDCKHEGAITMTAKTEKNRGRQFRSCPACKKFLGWVS